MEETNLPSSIIMKIVKQALPANIQVSKDARQAFIRAASIFVLYLTATATDFCRTSKRSTLTAEDILTAIEDMQFSEFSEPLKEVLAEYRKQQSEKRQAYSIKRAQKKAAIELENKPDEPVSMPIQPDTQIYQTQNESIPPVMTTELEPAQE